MNLKQLIKFGMEESQEPVIKNPVLRQALEPRSMDQASLVDDLEPGALKDEMKGKFDPDQETYEEYLRRINLERPFNMNQGGRIGFELGGSAALDMSKTLDELIPDEVAKFNERINTSGLRKRLIDQYNLPKSLGAGGRREAFNIANLDREELELLEDLLIDLGTRTEEAKKLTPGSKGSRLRLGVGQQGAKQKILWGLKDYKTYGQESLDALTESMFEGKKYFELGTKDKTAVKRKFRNKLKDLAEGTSDIYGGPEFRSFYNEALNNHPNVKGRPIDSIPEGKLTQARTMAAEEALSKLPKQVRSSIVLDVDITLRDVDTTGGIPKFKHGIDTSTDIGKLDAAKYGSGPEGKLNKFIDDVTEFYKLPRGTGGGEFSYAREAGLSIKDFQEKYFPDLGTKRVEQLVTNVKNKYNIPDHPTTAEYEKLFGKSPKKQVSEAAQLNKQLRKQLDPYNIKTKARQSIPGRTEAAMHHPFSKKVDETMARIIADTTWKGQKVGETGMGGFEYVLERLDDEKRALDLTTDAGRRRLAEIQAMEKRLLKGKDLKGLKIKSRTGQIKPIEPGKTLSPNLKGKFGYEKFTIDETGKVVKARKGIDLSQTVAAQHWNDVQELATIPKKNIKPGTPQFERAKNIYMNAYQDIGKTINNLNPREIGTICRAIRALPGFSSGGSAKCITKINKAFLERPDDLMRSLARISKPSGKLKGVVNMAKTLGRGTGWFALGELAIAVPWAAGSYALGANKDEIISDITYGLLGKDKEEQLKAADPLYGLPTEIMQDYKAYEDTVSRTDQGLVGTRMGAKPGALKKATQSLYEKQKPFINEKGEFDMELFWKQHDKNRKAEEDWEKEKIKRKEERGLWNPEYDVFTDELMAAEGGIASLKK